MPWSYPRSTPEECQTPAGCLAPGDPRVCSRLLERRQNPEPSAALVIPTRIKSASTTATWISSGSTLPNALCPMECRVIEDLSGSNALLVNQRLSRRRRRLSAAFVLRLTQTLSATLSACQAFCRWGHYRITRESQVLDEGLDASPSSAPLLEEMGPSFLFGPYTICYALLPPWVQSHSRKELWSLTRLTFLSIITLGASSIRPSGFKNSSANSMQIPQGYPLSSLPCKTAWGIIFTTISESKTFPLPGLIRQTFTISNLLTERHGLHLTLSSKTLIPAKINFSWTIKTDADN